uniref:Uncharacterized protein n=1 Tax=Trypanosoma vivax (strain Y486) TaxID=1055687 RepID=G0U8X1_TRYVY|nr:conserved hypothetical protein [Trypanosoma vivax Y486]
MEQENNWEAALMVTAGARKGNHFAYLVRQNLEKAVRTLLIAGRHGLVADFCLAYTSEVLLSDDVLVAVFDTCRRSEKKSMALYESLRPFLAQWTPAVYACCLTVTAQFKWQEALLIYHDYVNRRLQLGQTLIARLLSQVVRPIGGLREEGSGPAASSPNHTLQFLYHIMVPLVAERQPEHLEQIYRHMMVHEPEAAADVMLRCLQNERGRALATHWLRESSQSSVGCGTVSMDVFSLASALYSKKPNVMNLNSLIRVMAATESSLHCPSDAERLQQYVREVPMADTDAYVLARTVTDEHGHWKLATQLMTAMIARRQFHVVPSLSAHVARQGRWALAAKAMAVCLSNRGSFSPAEFQLCVHSSVLSGRWRSAFFWMERAHAAGVRLSSDTYDGAYGVARHCSWLESLRAVVSMHAAGGASSSGGILNVLEAAGEQGKVDKALRVICGSGGVFWTL